MKEKIKWILEHESLSAFIERFVKFFSLKRQLNSWLCSFLRDVEELLLFKKYLIRLLTNT